MSGSYKQCAEYLSVNDGYSIWGVACEVFQKRTGELKIRKRVKDKDTIITVYDSNERNLPLKVSRYFGINEATEYYLNYLCDEECADFEEAVIELIERFDLLERKSTAYYGSYGWGCD